jgi:lysophospholipase L1-like esterase
VPNRRPTDLLIGLLAPLVRIGALTAELSSDYVPRPMNDPHGFAPGPNADRILIVGSGLAVGWGVASHAIALPGALARSLSARTGRGCTVDLVAAPEMDAANVLGALDAVSFSRYDSVIIVLGVNDALHVTPSSEWRENLSSLLAALIHHTANDTPLIVMGIPPIRSIPVFDSVTGSLANLSARRLNAITSEVCETRPETIFVPLASSLPSEEGRHRTSSQYRELADTIAHALLPRLTRSLGDRQGIWALTPERERQRQRSVDALALADAHGTPALKRLALLAKEAYGTETALITVLDGGLQWYLAAAGNEIGVIPRELAMCQWTVQTHNGLIVRDTLADDRFSESPLVTSGPKIRFYAGFPLETPDGERIGAMCVLDSSPRRRQADLVDTAFLQQLAVLAQNELWRYRTVGTKTGNANGIEAPVGTGNRGRVARPRKGPFDED